jgi:glycosyltransferase involved in cell wall biosynthesis
MSAVTASTATTAEPLNLAFLGDPNSVHLRRWVSYFAARGHTVTMLVREGKEVEPGLPPAIAVERFSHFAARGRVTPTGLLKGRRSLRRAVARIGPDVLNAHFLTVHGWNAWMSGFHPYVVTLWGSDVFIHARKSRAGAVLARLALRSADMVMVNSETLMHGALAVGAPAERTEMVQFGVDLTRFMPGPAPAALRAHLGLEGRRIIFSPRAITPLYRHQIVVEALTRLPSDVVVLMSRFRGQADEVDKLERLTETLGLADRVVLMPEFEESDIPDLYRMADVVVSVPASDSTAATILEALACGKQIVAGDLPSVREWLWDLDGSALVPIDDVSATAAALVRALDRDPMERAELGRRARAIVETRADQAATLARVESLYRELAKRSRRGSAGSRP